MLRLWTFSWVPPGCSSPFRQWTGSSALSAPHQSANRHHVAAPVASPCPKVGSAKEKKTLQAYGLLTDAQIRPCTGKIQHLLLPYQSPRCGISLRLWFQIQLLRNHRGNRITGALTIAPFTGTNSSGISQILHKSLIRL